MNVQEWPILPCGRETIGQVCGFSLCGDCTEALVMAVRGFWMAAVGVALSMSVAAVVGGCASRPSTPKTPAEDYAAMYATGQYQAALEASSKVAGSLRAYDKAKASLIAGLSAQALNRNTEAKKFLTPLLEENDPGIAGKAAAALGLIAQEAGQHAEAANLLSAASKQLLNDDKARAAMYAGDSFRAIGKLDEAQRHYLLAQEAIREEGNLRLLVGERLTSLGKQVAVKNAMPKQNGTVSTKTSTGSTAPSKTTTTAVTPPLRTGQSGSAQNGGTLATAKPEPSPSFKFQGVPQAVNRSAPNGYSVQAGSFASWNSAISKAGELKRYGQARIVEVRDQFGRRLYSVRLGNYPSEEAAEGMRGRLGRTAVIVPAEE
jgi:tetratricopeptide (TPR) repeat protein